MYKSTVFVFLLIPSKSYLSTVDQFLTRTPVQVYSSYKLLHLEELLVTNHTMDVIRGELDIQIIAARNLPDTDNFLFSMFKKDYVSVHFFVLLFFKKLFYLF